MTKRTTIERGPLPSLDRTDAGTRCGAVTIEENFLSQILTLKLRLLHAPHIFLHKRCQGALLRYFANVPSKPLELLRKTGKKRLREPNLAVR